MRSTKIIKICSSSLCTCLHHIVILKTRNKITDFLMILAWASPFKYKIENMNNISEFYKYNIPCLRHFEMNEQLKRLPIYSMKIGKIK